MSPTKTRARIYDRDGYLLLDSRSLTSRSTILRFDLPDAVQEETIPLIERTWNAVKGRLGQSRPAALRGYRRRQRQGLSGGRALARTARRNRSSASTRNGETVVSVAVPIQRFRTVRGALLLSTQGGDIDEIIAKERWAIVRIFLVSAGVMLLLSLFFAGTIAEPIRRLAEAAERVRWRIKSRQEIPDFSDRSDEIGHLSGALRDMTGALYGRIEAIESFAADVAHELKNPLTSLRSAVETLPIAKTDESRKRLLDDRASRRAAARPAHQRHFRRLAPRRGTCARRSAVGRSVRRAAARSSASRRTSIAATASTSSLEIAAPPPSPGRKPWRILAHDLRLGQVFNNLIDNARSFSPEDATVRVALRAARGQSRSTGQVREGYEVTVDDDGPGIPAHAFERIFERFYTDRPTQNFGQNSGLGLSISRQIVEAHGGRIRAANRTAPADPDEVLGARFTVWLPAET